MGAKSPEEADNGSEEKKHGDEANFEFWIGADKPPKISRAPTQSLR
jgi:hypothetical protein